MKNIICYFVCACLIFTGYISTSYAEQNVIKLKPTIRILPAEPLPEPASERSHKRPRLDLSYHVRPVKETVRDTLVLDPKVFACAPTILAVDQAQLLASCSEKIFARLCHPKMGAVYFIYRPAEIFKDPKTQQVLGQEAIFLGEARVVEIAKYPKLSTLVIQKTIKEIKKGDKIFSYQPMALVCRKNSGRSNCGVILSVLNGFNQIGPQGIAVISGGCNQWCVGDRLQSFRVQEKQKCITLPLQRSGELKVIQVFDNVSFARVTCSQGPIYVDETVRRI